MAGSTCDKTILRGMLQRIAALYDPAESLFVLPFARASAPFDQVLLELFVARSLRTILRPCLTP